MLLLAGCSRDARLQEQVVGTWARGEAFEMTIAADGSFSSVLVSPPKRVTFQGTWRIENGDLVSTLTNCIAEGITNVEAVGSIEHYRILSVDGDSLVYTLEGQEVSLSRKR